MIGIASDGASSLTGAQSGACAYLGEQNPFMMRIHCASHRLALANQDLQKKIPYLESYVDTLCDIHGFFAKSSLRNQALKTAEIEFNEPELVILRMCLTRWLSLSNCVKRLSKIVKPVLRVLEEEMAKDKKTSTAYNPSYKEILTYKFQAFTHFLIDILEPSTRLTLKLQTQEMDIADYFCELDLAMIDLKESFIDSNSYGPSYRQFLIDIENKTYLMEFVMTSTPEMKKEIELTMKTFSLILYENLRQRFNFESLQHFHIFSADNIRSLSNDKVSTFGCLDLDKLIEHYGFEKMNDLGTFHHLIDATEARQEWRMVKLACRKAFLDKTNMEFWIKMYQSHLKDYPNILKLAIIAFCLPLTTVACERGFSKLKIIKDPLRSSLGT